MEVEAKARVKSLREIEEKLKARGAKLVKSVVQKADYYAPPWKQDFKKKGTFLLRIRKEGKKTVFSIKKLSSNPGARIEFETAVEDPLALEKILAHSGFKKIASVNKKRGEYSMGKVHYCLDDVEGLGKFVEVESFSSQGKKTLSKLEKLLHSLGLKRTTRKGYVEMVFEKKGK